MEWIVGLSIIMLLLYYFGPSKPATNDSQVEEIEPDLTAIDLAGYFKLRGIKFK